MQSPVGIQRWGQIDTKITFKLVLQKNDSIIAEIENNLISESKTVKTSKIYSK